MSGREPVADERAPGEDPADAGNRRALADPAGVAAAVVIGVVLAAVGMVRHANWWSGAIDLGVFDQGIWLLSRGHAPEVTINGRNLFADHLSPVVVLFVPLYRLAATPHWLFAAQGAALGATVLPLRALARDLRVPPWVATVAVAGGTPLAAAAMFEFHPATLAVPFVAWTVLEARRDHATRALVAGLLVLFCRSELAWVLVGIAVVAGPASRRRLVPLGVAGVVAGFAVPAVLGGEGTFDVHFGHLGSSPGDAVTHPWRVLEALLSADTVTKLVILLLPLAGLTLLSARWAVATLVASLPVLLSQWPGTSLPWFHYWAPMYPVAAAGALAVLGGRAPGAGAAAAGGDDHDDPRSPTSRPRSPLAALVDPRLVVVGGALALLLMSPLSPRAPDSVGRRALTERRDDRATAAAQVGDGEAVVASNRILSHLTHRREAWLFPAPYAASDPPELGADPSVAAQRRVDVVVVEGADAERAEDELALAGRRVAGILVVRP